MTIIDNKCQFIPKEKTSNIVYRRRDFPPSTVRTNFFNENPDEKLTLLFLIVINLQTTLYT